MEETWNRALGGVGEMGAQYDNIYSPPKKHCLPEYGVIVGCQGGQAKIAARIPPTRYIFAKNSYRERLIIWS